MSWPAANSILMHAFSLAVHVLHEIVFQLGAGHGLAQLSAFTDVHHAHVDSESNKQHRPQVAAIIVCRADPAAFVCRACLPRHSKGDAAAKASKLAGNKRKPQASAKPSAHSQRARLC